MPEGALGQNFKVSTGPLPASRKVFVPGKAFSDLRVAMREIDLTPSSKEPPIRAYDPSGPYTDPAAAIDIRAGLNPLRAKWILERGDVEAYAGREVRPEDNGLGDNEASAVPLFNRAHRQALRVVHHPAARFGHVDFARRHCDHRKGCPAATQAETYCSQAGSCSHPAAICCCGRKPG